MPSANPASRRSSSETWTMFTPRSIESGKPLSGVLQCECRAVSVIRFRYSPSTRSRRLSRDYGSWIIGYGPPNPSFLRLIFHCISHSSGITLRCFPVQG
jgi:hypothetical protein